MIRYHDALQRRVKELNIDVKMFFRMAHIYAFGSDPDVTNDVTQLRVCGIIPQYVCRYIDSLEVK